MLSPAPEDDRTVAAGSVAAAIAPQRAISLLCPMLLVAAVTWLLFDAAMILRGTAPLMAQRALPALAALLAGALALLLRRSPRWPRIGAGLLDLAVVALLVAAAMAGFRQQHVVRVWLQALAAAVVVGGLGAHTAASARRSMFAWTMVATVSGAVAALLHPAALAVLGPAGVQATSVALLAAAVLLRLPELVSANAASWHRPFAVMACLICVAWAGHEVLLDAGAPVRALFGAAVAATLAVIAVRAGWLVVALVALTCLAAVWWQARTRALDQATVTVLATDAHAVAGYDRSSQTMLLSVDGDVVDRAGPDHTGAELAATLLHLFAAPGDRVLVLGAGSGRLPAALLRGGLHEVEVVDARGDAPSLRAALAGDGPVVSLHATVEPRLRTSLRSWRQALASLADGSRQALVVAEQPNASAPLQATVELQRELRRVVGDGIVLQPFALDLVAAARLRALLAAAVVAHAWNGVLVVGDDAWLLSAAAAPGWPAGDVVQGWTDDARWLAHAAHVGGVADVRCALNGTVLPAAAVAARSELDPPVDAAPGGRRAALGVLHDVLRAEPLAEVTDPRSLLLRWFGHQSNLRTAADQLAGLGDTDADRAQAQAIAVRYLPIGAPSACLQAALGLPAADGLPLVDPALAIRRAHAIDPTFCNALPPVLRDALGRPLDPRGDLEDLAALPARERLADLCVGASPLAAALRARFGSACARALVELLAVRALQPVEVEALRELADPFVLDEAGRVLVARGAAAELLAFWRRDLPMPSALATLLHSEDPAAPVRLARALGGRTDADSLRALADCLAAPAVEVRRAAASALSASVGDRVAYDPEWPRSALIEAADRLRALHNRTP